MEIKPPSRPAAQAAYEAEKDANSRIRTAHERAKEAERQAAQELEYVKDDYRKQTAAEIERQDSSYEAQRNKGYENLRELKRRQDEELKRVKRDGERTLRETDKYYKDTTSRTKLTGEDKLRETQIVNDTSINHEKRMGIVQMDNMKRENEMQVKRLHEQHEAAYKSLSEAGRREYDRLRENTVEAKERSEKVFQEKYQALQAQQKGTIDELHGRSSEQIKNIRQDTAQKLSAYASRQNDPFYKMLDLDADLTDIGDAYVLTARIPEHEQGRVTVAIKGNQLMITGYRRNEEKLEISPGRTKGTASHQSFSESFPLAWPVDGKKLEKYFDGDELYVKVPKKHEYAIETVYTAPKPDRIKVERPKFPDNLPKITDNVAPEPAEPQRSELSSRPVSPGRGGRTLG